MQFCLFIIQSVWLAYTDCYQPRIAGFQLGFQCTIFLGLFANFYLQSYTKKTDGGKDKAKSAAASGAAAKDGKDGKKKKQKPQKLE